MTVLFSARMQLHKFAKILSEEFWDLNCPTSMGAKSDEK